MLRLIYTETEMDLEYLARSVEEWIALRVSVSRTAGRALRHEICRASFLLPAHLSKLSVLQTMMDQGDARGVTLAIADPDWIEICLKGIWVSAKAGEVEGVFVATVGKAAEQVIAQLWQEAQRCVSTLRT